MIKRPQKYEVLWFVSVECYNATDIPECGDVLFLITYLYYLILITCVKCDNGPEIFIL